MAAAQLGLIPVACVFAYVDGRKVGLLDNDAVELDRDLADTLKECIEQTPFQQLLGPGNLVLRRLHAKAQALKALVSRQADYDALTTTHLTLINTAFNARHRPPTSAPPSLSSCCARTHVPPRP